MTQDVERWNLPYDADSAPWLIGEAQPAVTELVERGQVRGAVLDVGCGAGEHTIHLARLGYDVLGVDLAPSAVRYARANAQRQGVTARFEVADATRLDGIGPFDTVLDSALFHVFAARGEQVAEYVRSLHAVCKPGGLLHVLALSDTEEGFGPRIGDRAIRDGFADGWTIELLEPSRYRVRVPDGRFDTGGIDLAPGTVFDAAAWLATMRRS